MAEIEKKNIFGYYDQERIGSSGKNPHVVTLTRGPRLDF